MTASTNHRVRGDDWVIDGTIEANDTPVNLTGASIVAQLREGSTEGPLALTFTDSVLSASDGTVRLTATDTQTAALTPGWHYYDVEVTISGSTTTYGAGSRVMVHADATRVSA